MQETWYAFRQTKEQEVVLYRVYGQSPVVTIPEKIAGNRVTELAAYCFAARTIPDDCLIASNDQIKSRQELNYIIFFPVTGSVNPRSAIISAILTYTPFCTCSKYAALGSLSTSAAISVILGSG